MRKTKEGANWQPYSFYINGKYYSYQRMEPIGKVIGIAADLVEMMSHKEKHPDSAKMGFMLLAMFGNATISTTYLSGLASTMETLLNPEQRAESFVESYAGSLIPKIIGQTVGMMDPYDREVNGITEAFMKQLPFLRQKLLPKIDVWGEKVDRTTLFKVLPIATNAAATEKVKQEAVRLQFAIADAPRFVEERGPFQARDKRTEYTPEQRNVFREVTGKAAMEILRPIVNDPDWDRTPDYAQAEVFKRVFTQVRKIAQQEALPIDSEGRKRIQQKVIDEMLKQDKEAEQRSKPRTRIE
jgi:hypothetical protein